MSCIVRGMSFRVMGWGGGRGFINLFTKGHQLPNPVIPAILRADFGRKPY